MAVRVYLDNPWEAKESILWLEESKLRYKIMRDEKAIEPSVRVMNPGMWLTVSEIPCSPEHLNDEDKNHFYTRIRDLRINQTASDISGLHKD